VGSALLAAAREECRQRHRGSLLLVCEEASRSGQAFVAACGGRYQNAEYRMKLDLARLDAAGSSPADVRLERSRLEDATIVAHILASSFGGSEEQALHRVVHDLARSTHRLYTAWMSGEPIGRLGLVAEGLRVYIIGFAILPEHRNKGYGRAVLAATVRMLFAEGQKDIFLEVATDNLPALALYRSFGFLETTRYGFYWLNVSPGASG
jgi:ribosomal protein S18 acetylase RimI-like enzyme